MPNIYFHYLTAFGMPPALCLLAVWADEEDEMDDSGWVAGQVAGEWQVEWRLAGCVAGCVAGYLGGWLGG